MISSSDQSPRESGEGSSSTRSVVLNTPDHHHHHHPYPHPYLPVLPQQQQQQQQPSPGGGGGGVVQLSRYESQKRRDWNTFGQYLRNQRPPVPLTHCNYNHVLDFLRYLDQFGKTKVHLQVCVFFGHPEPAGPCTCPLRQAWGSLDALIGRLRAAYEENGGVPDKNPFASGTIRVFLREIRDSQAKARGIPYKKKKKQQKKKIESTVMKTNDQNSSFQIQPS